MFWFSVLETKERYVLLDALMDRRDNLSPLRKTSHIVIPRNSQSHMLAARTTSDLSLLLASL